MRDFVPIEQLAGTRSATEFGYNVGAAVNWRAWPKASLFLEVRLHSLRGDSPGQPSPGARTADANSRLVPVILGVRF